jgi:threonine/homoserine/homoserine lactone efflux protein
MTGSTLTNYRMFLGVSLLIIVTAGPDTPLTIRNTLLGGRAGGMGTAFGVATGQLIWACAACLGMVALLVTYEPLFAVAKYGGAVYLVYLRIRAMCSARRSHMTAAFGEIHAQPRISARVAYRHGVISNLNPDFIRVSKSGYAVAHAAPGATAATLKRVTLGAARSFDRSSAGQLWGALDSRARLGATRRLRMLRALRRNAA